MADNTREPRITVLVVEDDPDTSDYMRTILTKGEQMDVRTTPSPLEALEILAAEEFDVLVTDIELPGMSGLELVGKVRQIAPHTRIIVMTAHASMDYAVGALRQEADEFLVKPVRRPFLVRRITELAIEGRTARQTPLHG